VLEIHERELAKQGEVKVEVRMIYSNNSKVLMSGATVPDAFVKTIITKNVCEKYFFNNEEPKYPNYQMYKIK